MLRSLTTKCTLYVGEVIGLCSEMHPAIQVRYNSKSNIINMASPWKESSSIIIASKLALHESIRTNLGDLLSRHAKSNADVIRKYNYNLLLLKRKANSSFMANAYVFPGGITELPDYSTKWWNVFKNAGVSREFLMQLLKSIHGPRPPMFTDSITLAEAKIPFVDCFPPELALRISAIRETFEETGLLLLTSFDYLNEKNPLYCTSTVRDTEIWRKKIHKNPGAFIDMCLETKLCPHIWCLYEWWNWLTPSIGHRRFDTMFYICCLPKVPDIAPDQVEITAKKWFAPDEILNEVTSGTLFLPPPQIYETSRLLNFYHFQDLEKFCKQRECKGIERWMGTIFSTTDGTVVLYPGDSLYPEECDPKALFEHRKFPHTTSHIRNESRNLHRTEINGQTAKIYCNIIPPCGHLQPLSQPPESHMVHSQL